MILTIISLVVGLSCVLSVVMALKQANMLVSVLLLASMILSISVLYLLLAAPDVAMTEAAIGSGLTTLIFLFAFRQLKKDRN